MGGDPVFQRLKPRWETFVPAFYWGLTHVVRFALMTLTHWKAEGRERVPLEGPLIIVSNHLSNTDPGILSAGVLGRRIRYMAKIELFESRIGFLIKLYGAFPVRRFEADVGALLTAERILRANGVIGMFPEGHRSRDQLFARPHPGTAMIALRSGATVLPCAIIGTEVLKNPLRLVHRPPIAVIAGEPIHLAAVRRPTEAQVRELSERIYTEIRTLLPDRYTHPYTEKEGVVSIDGGDNTRN
jgi:1-acyl-sn-glycerol-3-phosphate acyltransferase